MPGIRVSETAFNEIKIESKVVTPEMEGGGKGDNLSFLFLVINNKKSPDRGSGSGNLHGDFGFRPVKNRGTKDTEEQDDESGEKILPL